MQRLQLQRYTLLLLTLTLLSACGFHLRGSMPNPQNIDSINLNVNTSIPLSFRQQLRQRLELYNVEIDNTAEYTLNVDSIHQKNRRVASSRTTFTDRYSLQYRVNASLNKEGQSWPVSAFSERLFQDDRNNPSGKLRERERIYNELERQTINNLITRVRSFEPPSTTTPNSQ